MRYISLTMASSSSSSLNYNNSSSKLKSFLNTSFLLLLCFFFTSHIRSPSPPFSNVLLLKPKATTPSSALSSSCAALQRLADPSSKCAYLRSPQQPPCVSQGYLNYLRLFYCVCGPHPAIGHSALLAALAALFYLLGNTASHYFCSSVERLSRELRLSPAVAGATLLSLGNGSPDVFASVVSFRSGSAEVGLASVLGGAFFVSCAVVGVINVAAPAPVRVDRASFVRDLCFFLVVLSSLLAVLAAARVDIWAAAAFTSLYFVYVTAVSATHLCSDAPAAAFDDGKPLLEDYKEEEEDKPPLHLLYDHSGVVATPPLDLDFWARLKAMVSYYASWFFYIVEMPLYLPRRLTIPDVSDERWSRPYAVASAALAPLLIAGLWTSKRSASMSSRDSLSLYLYAGLVGLVLSSLALHTTQKPTPPKSSLFPWLAASFLMSVLWTYIIAEELVGLLVSIGYILGITPGILGLTVLAWGNSIGDLIANLAMAMNGGPDGAQIAISGCYAGPIFNTLAGLGLSLVVSAWTARPEPFEIPAGPAVFEILGFMICGLVWALVMLPRKDMKLDRVVGIGLLAIYLCFLSLRLTQSLGLMV